MENQTDLDPTGNANTACSRLFQIGQSSMRLEDAPCAAYLVCSDSDFTLACGNDKFFRLIGCTRDELRTKYGNRLSALMDPESLKALPSLLGRTFAGGDDILRLEQHVHRADGGDVCMTTSVVCIENEGKPYFCCFSFDFTEEREQLLHLHSLESIVQFVTQRIKYEMFVFDMQTGSAQVYTSQAVLHELFPNSEEVYPNFFETFFSSGAVTEESVCELKKLISNFKERGTRTTAEIKLRFANGEEVWTQISMEYHTLRGEDRRYAICILEDITQQKEAMMNFLRLTQFFQVMLSETTAYGQLDVTEDRFFHCGGLWDLYNEIIGVITYSQLFTEFINKVVHPEDRKHYLELMDTQNLISSLENGIDKLGCEFRRIVEQNKMVWMRITIHLFRDSMTGHVMALLYLRNIDAEKKRQLSHQYGADRDLLMNIYSYQTAENTIRTALDNVRDDEISVLIALDVDNFKLINRRVGDDIIITFTAILSRSFRKNDVIGRLDGDEFIVFIRNIRSAERIQKRLETLYEKIRQERAPSFTCSAGVASTSGKVSYEQLLAQAMAALHSAKQSGKDRFVFYSGQEAPPVDIAQLVSSTAAPVEQPTTRREVLPASVASLNAMLAEQGDIAYLVDVDTYDLIACNKAFYDRLGRTEEQCRGMKCYEAMQMRKTPCPFCTRSNWSSDKFYIWRNMNQALEQEFLIKNKLAQWEGRTVMLAIAVDISNSKTIVDSLENDSTENFDILSGIQNMTEAATLDDAMVSAMETIGTFFRADSAQLWCRSTPNDPYRRKFEWFSTPPHTDAQDDFAVDEWLRERKWDHPVLIETPDMMLSHSYEMYQMMKRDRIMNQRWLPLMDGTHELGCLVIQNTRANFRNVSFLETFSGFIAAEHKRRGLIDSIIYASTHDELTDLLNRTSYDRFLREFKSDCVRSVGVVFADFNGLRSINAKRGYHVGDMYLSTFADMLRQNFPNESLFRINGDEFLILAPDIGRDELDHQVEALRAEVADNGQFNVSIGHCWDNVENDLSKLIDSATQMMNVNKKRHYDAAHNTDHQVRGNMLQELMVALERREYEVFLQPKVDFMTHSLIGAEALIRYRDKKLGIVPPGQFIGIMEQNNFIRYIDLFVFEEVCRLLEGWKHQGISIPVVSLNFSRLTLLESDIVSSVETIFSQFDIPREKVEIEVTESFADMGKGILSQAVGGLYRSGFSISLDDFGTKYTNLSLLSDMKFNVLKLDKSLINTVEREDRDRIILKNIISMCSDLDIEVIAEGVETQEQEDILRSLGCRLGQGYLYGKPMEIKDFEALYMNLPKN